jgi:hypothetical protein
VALWGWFRKGIADEIEEGLSKASARLSRRWYRMSRMFVGITRDVVPIVGELCGRHPDVLAAVMKAPRASEWRHVAVLATRTLNEAAAKTALVLLRSPDIPRPRRQEILAWLGGVSLLRS